MFYEHFHQNSAASLVLKLQTNFYYRICGMQVTIFLVFQTSKLLNLSLKLRLLLGLEDRQKKKLTSVPLS